jgi:hypothetical protein
MVALALLPVWLGDSFPGAVWVAPVAGLLTIAAKVIEVVRSAPADTFESLSMESAPEPSKTSRILWG